MAKIPELILVGGADFYFTLQYKIDSVAQTITAPLMEIRNGPVNTATRLARFDTTGSFEGTITGSGSTTLQVSMQEAQTAAVAALTSKAYFDIYGVISGNRVQLAAGIVNVVANVTSLS